jgi:hypothetical protein
MQNVGGLSGKCPDIVLIQAEGKTGDQVDRDVAMAKSANEYRKQMGQVPEQNKAQVYDGSWNGIDGGAGGSADTVGK